MTYEEYFKNLKHVNPGKKVYVAFLDVLGFSCFVENNSHDDTIKLYQCVIQPILDLSLTETAEQTDPHSVWIQDLKNPSKQVDLAPNLKNCILGSVMISDSIIISTQDDANKSLIMLIGTVRNFMARMLGMGFPLRGAISYGMCTMDCQVSSDNPNIVHHQMLGLPIIKAVCLEKEQNWSGCVIDESVIQKIGLDIQHFEKDYVVFYDVPMKKNAFRLMPVINWVNGFGEESKKDFNESKIRGSFTQYKKESDLAQIDEIIENTVVFFNAVGEYCPM